MGKVLGRGQFIRHVQALKDLLDEASVHFEKVIAEGASIATCHVVNLRKKSGEQVEMKVLAFFEIEDGLISRTEEFTRLIAGDSVNHDLGSRVSAME
jgi:ketosteroid isomerase-like protein